MRKIKIQKFIISDFVSPDSMNFNPNPIQSEHVQVGEQPQREVGQTSHGPAGQTKEKGKVN